MRFAALVLALVMLAVAAPGAQSVSEKQTAFEIEHELLKLPTYGVFDFIAFGAQQIVAAGFLGRLHVIPPAAR